ncbi:hypothetical protein MNBD_GAMMA17-1994 [hydrothermal vent metagenome]|uniref:non-specific protein-tyrosine kinase n=1 Tax=hydrothermal vent metagenome TaxID=652676 RepID=A0A3B1ACW6_9ZZZZ
MSSIERMMERLARQNSEAAEGAVPESVPERRVEKMESASDSLQNRGTTDLKGNFSEGNKMKPLVFQLNRLESEGYLPDNYEDSCQFSEFRKIKRPILKKAFPKEKSEGELPRNLVMISSAVPGEGKTFCAINLMLNIILERDITVLLMDVDCMRRSLSKVFGVEALPGLVDVLEGDTSIEDVIINTEIPQLKLIPAGRAHKHSAELLAGDRMKQLAAEIPERYADRIILMDAPPLLAANDAEILSQYAGQAIIVTEADKTPQSIIQQALICIDTEKTLTGLVLNKRQGGVLAENDSYGYYYSGDEESGRG